MIVQETTFKVKPYQKSSTNRMSNRQNHFPSSHNPCSNKIGNNNNIQHVYHMKGGTHWRNHQTDVQETNDKTRHKVSKEFRNVRSLESKLYNEQLV